MLQDLILLTPEQIQEKLEHDYNYRLEVTAFLPDVIRECTLTEFLEWFVYPFDKEATTKEWHSTAFQNEMDNIWNTESRSFIAAPREHLKTSSILAKIVKTLCERKYPIEIDYFHLNGDIAQEKFQKMKQIIENSPLIRLLVSPDEAKEWSQEKLELKDGTILLPLSYGQGTVGKHPHIIVLDDPIDRRVIYSEDRNKKAIDKFYSDIYPMISKDEPDKKIWIVGTIQKEDDLYNSLPADFTKHIYKAVIDYKTEEVLSPEIFTFASLMRVKQALTELHGEKYWLKEYMNVPFSAMGLIIKRKDIQWFTIDNHPTPLAIYQGWDLSVGKDIEKGDWTVGVTIGVITVDGKIRIYVLDVFRDRLSFQQRLDKVAEKAEEFNPERICIEENLFQYDTVQTLQTTTLNPIVGIHSAINKVERLTTSLAPKFENHQIYIQSDMVEFVNELVSLPIGQYDDQGDALDMAIKAALQDFVTGQPVMIRSGSIRRPVKVG